ncbi:hypothetical protein AGMMS49991_07980 [Spirochaetia bacterium]|nr:hypothetical protein AGMMS49991_07980 [Spirochaetia bacterium]
MKKSIALVICAALLASASIAAQEESAKGIGLTAGLEFDFNDVANENYDTKPISITPSIGYANTFLDNLNVSANLAIPLQFAGENFTGEGLDETDSWAHLGEPTEKFALNLILEEDVSYGLGVGPGTLSVGLYNFNDFHLLPKAPSDAAYEVMGIPDGYAGIQGVIKPYLGYELPLAGTAGVQFHFPIGYSDWGTLKGDAGEDWTGSFDLDWVLDWESEFGFGINYEGSTGTYAFNGPSDWVASDSVGSLATNSKGYNELDASDKTIVASWVITPRYTIGDLTAKVTFAFVTGKDDAFKSDGLWIIPGASYKLLDGALSLNLKLKIGNIGAEDYAGEAVDIAINPVLSVGYSF